MFLLGCLGLVLPMELTFLFLAVNIPNLLKYASICLAAARVSTDHPALHEQARFRMRPAPMRRVGLAGAGCAVALMAIGLEADWRPYALLLAWMIAGVLYRSIGTRRG